MYANLIVILFLILTSQFYLYFNLVLFSVHMYVYVMACFGSRGHLCGVIGSGI